MEQIINDSTKDGSGVKKRAAEIRAKASKLQLCGTGAAIDVTEDGSSVDAALVKIYRGISYLGIPSYVTSVKLSMMREHIDLCFDKCSIKNEFYIRNANLISKRRNLDLSELKSLNNSFENTHMSGDTNIELKDIENMECAFANGAFDSLDVAIRVDRLKTAKLAMLLTSADEIRISFDGSVSDASFKRAFNAASIGKLSISGLAAYNSDFEEAFSACHIGIMKLENMHLHGCVMARLFSSSNIGTLELSNIYMDGCRFESGIYPRIDGLTSYRVYRDGAELGAGDIGRMIGAE